jgi:hypothetical protein
MVMGNDDVFQVFWILLQCVPDTGKDLFIVTGQPRVDVDKPLAIKEKAIPLHAVNLMNFRENFHLSSPPVCFATSPMNRYR